MVDGIYSIIFRGAADWGMGLLLLRSGVVTGADNAGVLYDGTYVETESAVQFKIKLTVPPGVALVQGTRPQSKPYSLDLNSPVPKMAMNKSLPHLVMTPVGPVNVIFKKLRDLVS
jgi:hypothetical protein